MTGDRGPDVVDPANPNNDQQFKLDGQGLGNVALHFKTRFLKTSRSPHIGLGLVASVYLPTVTQSGRFLGDGNTVPELKGILDKEIGGRFRIALNGGIRLRSTTTFTNDDPGTLLAPVTGRSVTVGNEIPFGVAAAYAIAVQKFEVIAELTGSKPLGTVENYQPLEAIAGVKLYLARNSFLSLGAGRGLDTSKGANPDTRAFIGIVFEPNVGDRDGDGIKDDVDQCPDEPEDKDGFEDEDGCPDPDNDRDGIPDTLDKCPNIPGPPPDGCPIHTIGDRDGDGIPDNVDKCPDDPEDFDGFQDEDGCPDPDNDKDGILDVDDLCPNDPEDKDGFEDEDGCPDPDNDKDGILDKDDKCPNEPETFNGVQDEDGCPDRGPITLTSTNIIPLEPINFEYNKAVITKDSFHILDAVVAAMKGNPDIKKIEIQGHTDERGDDAYNLDLSDRRAAAVLAYLTEHGVEPGRLVSQGYGETQPIDRGHNEQAWAKNRRVEFLIIDRATD
jgi:outer membrane protein OmpA-like peptidoglycan-associated protein